MKRNDWIYATGKQETYLQALRNEAFANLYKGKGCVYITTGKKMLKSEASELITILKAAKENNWRDP